MEYEKISLWCGFVIVSYELFDILVVKSIWGGMGVFVDIIVNK